MVTGNVYLNYWTMSYNGSGIFQGNNRNDLVKYGGSTDKTKKVKFNGSKRIRS